MFITNGAKGCRHAVVTKVYECIKVLIEYISVLTYNKNNTVFSVLFLF